ncbi:MAG: porin [Lactobacillaceae bacterium]|jgi:hypothetical protein|nr:porin [Lactobacillaceae bacterium]
MKIVKLAIFGLPFLLSSIANAGEYSSDNFSLDYKVNIRGYYGVSETHKKDSHNNLPNRFVNRNDAKIKAEYAFNDDYKISWNNSSSLIFRQHDSRYEHDGEWRFYNWGIVDTPYGRFSAGEDFNAAYLFHKGAKDVGPMGITDTNLTWFVSNHNWKNGKKAVSFLTPKSTSILTDGRAAKVSYVTPKLGNTLLGFSYTPDTPSRRGLTSRYNTYERDDAYVAAMHNEWELDFADIYTSAGYGLFNRTDKELSLGLTLVKGGWTAAAGYRKSYIDGKKNQITTAAIDPRRPAYYDNYRESQSWDFSLGYEIGPVETSISYLHTKADNTPNKDDIIIWSNNYACNKWLDIYAIGAYLNSRGVDKQDANRNKGYAFIAGAGVNF